MDASIRPKTEEDRDGERFRLLVGGMLADINEQPLDPMQQTLRERLNAVGPRNLHEVRVVVDSVLDRQP